MKEKNRFSVLLEHLTSMANLKNYVLAKAVQYDESYISKWISGKSLPTEKNHEIILQNISQCIVEALTDDNRDTFLEEYQISDVSNLQKAIYDHLESEYTYVKELQVTTGSKVATKISYYPELTLDQFIFKMKHPSLRKVQSLNIYAMVDILNVDTNYQLLIAEFNSMHNDIGLVLPGVHFSLMIPKTACTPPTVKVKRKKGHIAVTYADNFFLPFARLAAKTFLPPGVLILALKP